MGSNSISKSTLIIGAGPAGLTAAYLLSKAGVPVEVLESDSKYLGGISRSVEYKGFLFDIGGHRFFSKSKDVRDLWAEILPNDMLHRPRLSRIFYRGQFFAYPLKALEALCKLGFVESGRCLLSYLKWRIFPVRDPKSFQDWVSNQFGHRLFSIFFKSYTEKVWGMKCSEISADWAAQRIKGLSLGSAIFNSIFHSKKSETSSQTIKTLIDSFSYPRKGPGMMWDACAKAVIQNGGKLIKDARVRTLQFQPESQSWRIIYKDTTGAEYSREAQQIISSAPLRELVKMISPTVPEGISAIANKLNYRDFLIVVLIAKEKNPLPDNWIYIHDPKVRVGRIQNFKSWSTEMIPTPGVLSYGMEYFCFEGDGIWNQSDAELIELAKTEIETIGIALKSDIFDGCVVRQNKAYPVYDDDYKTHVEALRNYLESTYPSLHLVGRNGMHKYNNQDHAMMTAMLTVKNILAGKRRYNIWNVNEDAEYHEGSIDDSNHYASIRAVPEKLK